MAKPGIVQVPRTLKQAKAAGLRDASVSKRAIADMTKNLAVSIGDDVPVGHLWHLGQPEGDTIMACYKTKQGSCHWVEVPINNVPDWDPGANS